MPGVLQLPGKIAKLLPKFTFPGSEAQMETVCQAGEIACVIDEFGLGTVYEAVEGLDEFSVQGSRAEAGCRQAEMGRKTGRLLPVLLGQGGKAPGQPFEEACG